MIIWDDKKALITPHITVGEATYLPSWRIFHIPNETEKANIILMCEALEKVREFVEKPIQIHVFIRPVMVNAPGSLYNARNYNQLVGGSPNSAHIKGLACDFNFVGITCDEGRFLLVDKLKEFGLRMERRDNSTWIHLDLYPPTPNRYFMP